MNKLKYTITTHTDNTLNCIYASKLTTTVHTHTNRWMLSLTIHIWNHAGDQTNNAFAVKKFCRLNLVDVTVVLVSFRNFWKSKKKKKNAVGKKCSYNLNPHQRKTLNTIFQMFN